MLVEVYTEEVVVVIMMKEEVFLYYKKCCLSDFTSANLFLFDTFVLALYHLFDCVLSQLTFLHFFCLITYV